MGTKERKQRSAEEKVGILREVLVEKKAISEVCEKHDLQPSLFYYWQKQFFENGAAAFRSETGAEDRALTAKVEKLEARLAKKDEVIAEVTAEFVKLKKELGEL